MIDRKILNWIDKNNHIDFKNKNVLITGSNSGIGLSMAYEFAYLKANIYLLVRNIDKGNKAREKILSLFPHTKIEIIKLDISSFESINEAISIIKTIDVDVFINNAGIFRIPTSFIYDNIEITMGTNFIGTYYLNTLLNDYFITLNHKVYNLFTTSITSRLYKINYDDFYYLKHNKLVKRYGKSKVAINNMFYYFKEKYENKNIIFSLIHPGATYTPLIKKGYKNKTFEKAASIFMKVFFHTPEKAALTSIYAMNYNDVCCVGPRGIFEISGYPKITKFKRNKDYIRTIEIANKVIKEKTNG